MASSKGKDSDGPSARSRVKKSSTKDQKGKKKVSTKLINSIRILKGNLWRNIKKGEVMKKEESKKAPANGNSGQKIRGPGYEKFLS